MIVFTPSPDRLSSRVCAAALLLLLFFTLAVAPGVAQQTHLWTQTRMDELEKGTPQGVAVYSDGHLREGPGLTEVLTTPSSYVWSVAAGNNGEVYLGTASPSTVLRIGKDGKPFTLFESKDVSVQAVRLGPDGALYAATLPGGKVYKLKPDANVPQDESSATVVFDLAKLTNAGTKEAAAERPTPAKTKEDRAGESKTGEEKVEQERSISKPHYIWDLAFDPAGRLYVAAGGPGAIYRLDPTKPSVKPERFFKSDEQHIRCLAWDGRGNLIAGTDGSGLVYRIDPQGKGYVLFEAPRREITSIAVGSAGTIYAATVGDKSRNPLPPLAVQGIGSVTITVVQPGSLQAANTSTSLPDGSEIYALTPPDAARLQAPRRIWAGKDEVIYALAAQPDGLLALTGNRGRLFKIGEDGSFADIAHLDAQQGLSMALAPRLEDADKAGAVFIGTGNTGKLVRLGAVDKHEYASDVLDAGALSRFGRVEVEPGSTGFELFTRTGNVEQPARGRNEWGWSDWQPLNNGQVASPAGRFLEWKAALHSGGALGSVGVNYLPVNSAPVVDDLVVVSGARVNPQAQLQAASPQTVSISFPSSGQNAISFDGNATAPLQAVKDRAAATARWAAHDDNGDDLIYALYLRGDGETVWRLLKNQIAEKAYSFDATMVPDGGYQIKVVASDAPANSPGDALTGAKVSDRFELDTTPPAVRGLNATSEPTPTVTFDAEDSFSPVVRAEYALDAGTWQFVQPVGGLSDSRQEHYQFSLPATALKSKTGEHLITVRVYDRHDNIGVAKAVFNVPAK